MGLQMSRCSYRMHMHMMHGGVAYGVGGWRFTLTSRYAAANLYIKRSKLTESLAIWG